jgi:hypothetical protein
MNIQSERTVLRDDIWSGPDAPSEAEQAARQLGELLKKWAASGSLQSVRYVAQRRMAPQPTD